MATGSVSQNVGYTQRAPIKVAPWHGLVAWDILFNGLATGLFLVAALGELSAPDTFAPVAEIAYPVALVFLLTDLILLVADLGDPWRFHHMLRVFKPTSPMSLGVWSLTVYSIPLTIVALLAILPGGATLEWARKTALVLGLAPAFASAVYKGVLLSTSAQPGWKDARWLGGYLTVGALVLGCAAMVILAFLAGEPRAAEVLRRALGILLVVHATVSVMLIVELRTALQRVFPRGLQYFAFVTTAVGSLVVPLALVAAGGLAWTVTAALIILITSLSARLVLVRLPHVSS
jgi:Ni/Fe-hydrogenase subunit HybB-like protein